MKIRSLSLVVLGVFSFAVGAFPLGGSNCDQTGYEKGLSDLVYRVNQDQPKLQDVNIVGQDDRMNLVDSAKQLDLMSYEKQLRSSTGYVYCPGSVGSGSGTVIISDDIIISAGHVVTDDQGNLLKGCVFQNQTDHPVQVYLDFSKPYILKTPGKDGADLLVVHLKQPLKGIKPFKLDMSQTPIPTCQSKSDPNPDCQVVMVSASESDLLTKIGINDPVVRKCTIHDSILFRGDQRHAYLGSCSTKDGASGGGVFIERNGELILKAITVSSGYDSNDLKSYFFDPHAPPNDPRFSGTYTLGIDGSFLKDVLQVAGKKGTKGNTDVADLKI